MTHLLRAGVGLKELTWQSRPPARREIQPEGFTCYTSPRTAVKVGPGGASLPLAVAFGRLGFVYARGVRKTVNCATRRAVTLLILLWSAFADTLVLGSVVGDVADVPAWCGNQR